MHWRRKWQPTPALLPGESRGGRSLVGYSPWGHKELDTTERLYLLTSYLGEFKTVVEIVLLLLGTCLLAGVQPQWIQGIRRVDGVGLERLVYLNLTTSLMAQMVKKK